MSELVAAIQDGTVKADYVQRRYGGGRHVSRGGGIVARHVYRGGAYGGRQSIEAACIAVVPCESWELSDVGIMAGRYYGPRYGYYGPGYELRLWLGGGSGRHRSGNGSHRRRRHGTVQQSVSYCAQRFRSYDPASGTYLGNDGRRHRCP